MPLEVAVLLWFALVVPVFLALALKWARAQLLNTYSIHGRCKNGRKAVGFFIG